MNNNLHPLITQQATLQPVTKMQMIKQEVQNLEAGTKTIEDLGRELALQPEMIEFAKLYTSHDNLGSNGLQCAHSAYNYPHTPAGKILARNTAHRLLKHNQVALLMAVLLDMGDLNDTWVDGQLSMLINQNNNLQAKAKAIEIYNDIKNRVKQTIEVVHTPAVLDFSVLSEQQLQQLIDIIQVSKIDNSSSTTPPDGQWLTTE